MPIDSTQVQNLLAIMRHRRERMSRSRCQQELNPRRSVEHNNAVGSHQSSHDNGPGIPTDLHQRSFGRFSRGDFKVTGGPEAPGLTGDRQRGHHGPSRNHHGELARPTPHFIFICRSRNGAARILAHGKSRAPGHTDRTVGFDSVTLMTTTSLPIEPANTPYPPAAVAAPAKASRWHRILVRGSESDPRWVLPTLVGAARHHRALPRNLVHQAGSNSFCSAAASGIGQLGSVLLRIVRCSQLDHGRQDPCLAVGLAASSDCSLEQLEHPGTPSPDGVATVGLLYATVRRAMNNRTSTQCRR